MQHMTSWGTSDHRVFVTLSDQVLAVLRKHVQLRDSDPESGGILLGHVRGENLEILEATLPTPLDRRMRYLFERMPFGHQLIANKRWAASNGTFRYLGEWHTHPEDIPTPSGLDRAEWLKLAKGRSDQRPLLTIIVGRASLNVELVSSSGTSVTLAAID